MSLLLNLVVIGRDLSDSLVVSSIVDVVLAIGIPVSCGLFQRVLRLLLGSLFNNFEPIDIVIIGSSLCDGSNLFLGCLGKHMRSAYELHFRLGLLFRLFFPDR